MRVLTGGTAFVDPDRRDWRRVSVMFYLGPVQESRRAEMKMKGDPFPRRRDNCSLHAPISGILSIDIIIIQFTSSCFVQYYSHMVNCDGSMGWLGIEWDGLKGGSSRSGSLAALSV